MKRSTLRLVAVVAVAAPTALAVAAPAAAASPDRFTSKTSGGQAYVAWTEYDTDDLLGLQGNTHVGNLSVYKQPGFTDVFGSIDDWQCDPGEVPGGGHGDGHGEEPSENTCDLAGTRYLQGTENVTYTMDVRSGVATLTGNLLVSNGGHGGGGVLARPSANITWTAVGDTYTFRRMETWTRGTATYTSAVRGSGFEAQVTGTIGMMGFADDADDAVHFASAEQWQERSRTRIR